MHTTRFAPSPTGLLHIGHAFAALTACEAAHGGTFLLRMEDLDISRSRPEFERAIEEDLHWLGLSWQQPVLRQSWRFDAYRAALGRLQTCGVVYPCFCTRREIALEAERASAAPHRGEQLLYPGTCRALSPAAVRQALAREQPHVLRLDVAKAAELSGALSFRELGLGPDGQSGVIRVDGQALGDIVLARRDTPVAYHLAVVVDDAFQGVSLVTRGNDLFSATHVQRLLQALLKLPVPLYAHHRLLLDSQGKKFSKRDRAVTLRSLRERGAVAQDLRARLLSGAGCA